MTPRIVGLLFSAAAVRLASMAFVIYVGVTIGGEAIDTLQNVSNVMSSINPE